MSKKDQVLAEIDDIIQEWEAAYTRSQYDDLSDLPRRDLSELVALLNVTISRFAPPSSSFSEQAARVNAEHFPDSLYLAQAHLGGLLKALRKAYERDYLATVQELVHADVFADFLEMAGHLLGEGYKDAAAVLLGGTLEEHLRKLCAKHEVDVLGPRGCPRKAGAMNDDLAKVAYDKLQQKGVTYWLDLRNKAAHGKYDEYTADDVKLMHAGLRDFIGKFRA